MTTARAAEELWDALCALREPLVALNVTVWEDRPRNDEVMLADSLGDTVVEACGWLEGAIGAVREARDNAGDAAALSDSLVDCGEQFDRLERTFWSGLASYERLAEVDALGGERSAWRGWSRGVCSSVADCGAVLHQARAALFGCWRELAGEFGRSLVTVNTTSVGQQISPARGRA
ncbi:MAG: hypothetical protein QOJ12_713 [Thermoleophilales bacterium]|jgi:hypothetical protein|nr:hypothetical protein [Thermoleophilales bacterium]